MSAAIKQVNKIKEKLNAELKINISNIEKNGDIKSGFTAIIYEKNKDRVCSKTMVYSMAYELSRVKAKDTVIITVLNRSALITAMLIQNALEAAGYE